jgi:acetoin:2,6-dichlorophenolindophenol oxidoreductase subunit beta
MKYKDAIKKSMEMLAKDERTIFIGYNIKYGSRAYGTLKDVPFTKCLETPLAENLMTGLAIGMSLEGFRPVLFYERHDFLLNGLDAIVNHLGKIEKMSSGEYKTPVIIRAVVGGRKPIDPGMQHTQDFTEPLRMMIPFPVIDLRRSEDVLEEYQRAIKMDGPILLVERRDLYESE